MKVLKHPERGVDPYSVKTCEGCGLPAPTATERCALCGKSFHMGIPTSYRLSSTDDGYRWTVDGDEIARAEWRDATWDIAESATGKVHVTVIPVAGPGDAPERFAIVDHRGRTAITYAAVDGIVRDSHGDPLVVVRGDGPTGLHVVDREGVVLALASDAEDDSGALDVLVTPAGLGDQRRLLLGLSLALALVPTPVRRAPRLA